MISLVSRVLQGAVLYGRLTHEEYRDTGVGLELDTLDGASCAP
jgi:hypothetical protein